MTAGGLGGLYSFTMALLREGEEAIMFEPGFPLFLDHVRLAGGVMRTVPMHYENDGWRFRIEDLKKAFNENTRLFIFNTPQNPTGKVFTLEEMK